MIDRTRYGNGQDAGRLTYDEELSVIPTWLRAFFPRSRSKAVFIFVMHCYSLTLASVTAQFIQLAGFWQTRVMEGDDNVLQYVRPGIDGASLANQLVIAPILESFIIIGVIELMRRLRFGLTVQVVTSVSVVCLLHALDYVFWAFAIVPSFFIDAVTYIYWRRVSFWVGTQMIIALHILFNSMPAITVIVERLRG